MMSRRNLFHYVDSEPFRPFRIKMVSGETIEIRHPEMISVGRTTAHVFTWLNQDNDDPKDREREISIILIESIEPLQIAKTQDQSQN